MKNYEVYLDDDQGRRIQLINNFAFLNLSRATRGFGTVHLGIPLLDLKVFPYFLPDRRIEVWRAPRHGATLRDEGTYLLRKVNVYTREQDNVQIIEFWGRSPIDILRRASVTSTTLADYQKTDEIDDMAKDIVLDSLITPAISVPTGEMTVDGSDALGPSITHSFYGQNVLDICNDLRDISFTKHEEDSANNRIYFDVVRGAPLATGGFGYIFRTYAVIRGTDRRQGVIFSPENGNVKGPSYYEDHLDSFTQAQILNLSTPAANGSATSPDATLSRWNTIVSAQQTSETSASVNDSKAFAVLQDGKADNAFNASFVDSPGSSTQPRSLYGVDWDLGDLLPVRYADKDLSVEVKTVYLSIDENGQENIVGMGELFEERTAPLENQIAFNAFSGSASAANETTRTFSHTTAGTNRYLRVTFWVRGAHTVNSVTYAGVAMTLIGSTLAPGTALALYEYGLVAPATGANNVIITLAAGSYMVANAISYTGVDQTDPIGAYVVDDGTTADATLDITGVTFLDLVVDTVMAYRSGNATPPTITVDPSQAQRGTQTITNASPFSGRMNSSDEEGDGTVNMAWTLTNNTNYGHIVTILHSIIP